MKKIIIPFAALLLAGSVALAYDWQNAIDFAEGKNVTVCSTREGAPENITKPTGNWSADQNLREQVESNDWFIVDLGEPKDFNCMEIDWQRNHPSMYCVYTSTTPFATEAKTTEDDNQKAYTVLSGGVTGLTPAYTGVIDSPESGYVSEIKFTETQTGKRYILIYAEEYNGWGKDWGIGVNQVKVGMFENEDALDHMVITVPAAEEGEIVEGVVTAYNKYNSAISSDRMVNLVVSCDDPKVALTSGEDGKFTLKSNTCGTYQIKAQAEYDNKAFSATADFCVKYNWATAEKVAGYTVTARINADNEIPNPASNVNDGNPETYYEYNDGWSDNWVLIDLGEDYMISAVGVRYAPAKGNFKIAFGKDGVANVPAGNINIKNDAMEGWFKTDNIAREDGVTTFYGENHQARYICFIDNDNPDGNPKVYEVMVSGLSMKDEPVATSMEITPVQRYITSDEAVEYNAVVKDQYGQVMEGQTVKYSIVEPKVFPFPNGSNILGFPNDAARGPRKVKAECGAIVAYDTFYITTNAGSLPDGNVKCTFGDEEVQNPSLKATREWPMDCGSDGNWPEYAIYFLDSEKNEKVFNLDLITLHWETACAEEYTLEGITAEGNRVDIAHVTGHTNIGEHYYDRFASTSVVMERPSSVAFGFYYKNTEMSADNMANLKGIVIKPVKINNGNSWTMKLLDAGIHGMDQNGMPTSVETVLRPNTTDYVDVYSISGVCVARGVRFNEIASQLPAGIYIAGGKKICIR